MLLTIEEVNELITRCVTACLRTEADARLDERTRISLQAGYIEATARDIVNGKRPTWPKEPI